MKTNEQESAVRTENRARGSRVPFGWANDSLYGSVTRGPAIAGAWAVMSGWTVITARLNIGWCQILLLKPSTRRFLKPWLVPLNKLTRQFPSKLGEPFYVHSYAMQCPPKNIQQPQLLANLITHCIRSRANPPFSCISLLVGSSLLVSLPKLLPWGVCYSHQMKSMKVANISSSFVSQIVLMTTLC